MISAGRHTMQHGITMLRESFVTVRAKVSEKLFFPHKTKVKLSEKNKPDIRK